MPQTRLQQIAKAIRHLNPGEVRAAARRPLRILLVARSSSGYAAMEDFLAPAELTHDRRMEVFGPLFRQEDGVAGLGFDLAIYQDGLPCPDGFRPGKTAFRFCAEAPQETVEEVLDQRPDLALALARMYAPFRAEVVRRTISTVSKENALFALASALPNVMPGIFSLPWAVGELASDTVVLTVNQIRMAFLLAAANNREAGFREQRSEIASLIAGAFGWRSLARELAGKIPFGGGLVAKTAVAYAGTYVAGSSLERLYRIGYGFTKQERRAAYEAAFERGKQMARQWLEGARSEAKAG